MKANKKQEWQILLEEALARANNDPTDGEILPKLVDAAGILASRSRCPTFSGTGFSTTKFKIEFNRSNLVG